MFLPVTGFRGQSSKRHQAEMPQVGFPSLDALLKESLPGRERSSALVDDTRDKAGERHSNDSGTKVLLIG
jgi:hypothetical protein